MFIDFLNELAPPGEPERGFFLVAGRLFVFVYLLSTIERVVPFFCHFRVSLRLFFTHVVGPFEHTFLVTELHWSRDRWTHCHTVNKACSSKSNVLSRKLQNVLVGIAGIFRRNVPGATIAVNPLSLNLLFGGRGRA